MTTSTKKRLYRIAFYASLITITLVILAPYLWMVFTSLKTKRMLFASPPVVIFKPTLNNYISIFIQKGYWKYLANSVIIALSATFLTIFIGTPCAYAFSRFKMKGDKHLFFAILTTRMAPPITIALPMYIMFGKFGLIDTHIAVILAHTTFNLVLVVWVMKGFFDEIPREIDESALVDGCTEFMAYRKIILPLAVPGIVAVSIFCFIFSWNELLFSLILTAEKSRTLPASIPSLVQHTGTLWGQVAAVATIATVPVLIFTFIVQKHLVRGLSFGAVK